MTIFEVHPELFEECPICKRLIHIKDIEKHHIYPKSIFGDNTDILLLCGSCHDILHYVFKNEKIHTFNTPDRIIEALPKYIKWISTKRNSKIYKLPQILKGIEFHI